MALTLEEVKERLMREDEVSLLEILNIDAEMIVERFSDLIEERADSLEEELEDIEDED